MRLINRITVPSSANQRGLSRCHWPNSGRNDYCAIRKTDGTWFSGTQEVRHSKRLASDGERERERESRPVDRRHATFIVAVAEILLTADLLANWYSVFGSSKTVFRYRHQVLLLLLSTLYFFHCEFVYAAEKKKKRNKKHNGFISIVQRT